MMKVVLATGIYPPDIGGPATYVAGLEKELMERGLGVTVVTYGRVMSGHPYEVKGRCVRVSNAGSFLARWLRYRKALKMHAGDADAVIAFTSVSAGIPLMLSGIRAKKILRLGGDFFWERYTDAGGSLGLDAWLSSRLGMWRLLNMVCMHGILSSFSHIVYSTAFQQSLHRRTYKHLPPTSVIENAVPAARRRAHRPHTPFRLLFVGRLVRFKRVPVLLEALAAMPDGTLTVTGSGPELRHLEEFAVSLGVQDRITFMPPILGDAKEQLFAEHDLLVIPSVTEISPNVALEAVSTGLPVLLTSETGLSDRLSKGMLRAPVHSKMELLAAIMKARSTYDALASAEPVKRSWSDVADEWISLLLA